MYHAITSGAFHGMDSFLVQVEVDVSNGIPCMDMVGCLASEVKETKERVRVGIKNSGFEMPVKRITVSLSPADIKKDGSAFDLPVALGILGAVNLAESCPKQGDIPACEQTEVQLKECTEEQSDNKISNVIVLGELGLDGNVKGVRGILPTLLKAAGEKITSCIIPYDNRLEASNVKGMQIYPVENLKEAYQVYEALYNVQISDNDEGRERNITFLQNKFHNSRIDIHTGTVCARTGAGTEYGKHRTLDFKQVYGQEHAKRAALIAAAGFHNLLLFGPPGSGKSMIAERIPTIMPDMSYEECIEVTKIYSVAGLLDDKTTLITKRPFMSPHHTVTNSALVGGGSVPRPGMVTLAHKGILFLDELPEFGRGKLDLLRQPLEEKKVQISRMLYTCNYQSDFMLVAAMNPCPCGFYPDRNKCNCRAYEIERYLGNISGPLLDRIDISVEVGRMKWEQIFGKQTATRQTIGEKTAAGQAVRRQAAAQESSGAAEKTSPENEEVFVWDSAHMQQLADAAVERQMKRNGCYNGALTGEAIERCCVITQEAEQFLKYVFEKMELSMRSLLRLKKVARTIADLEGADKIAQTHISEAIILNKGLERLKRKKVAD